MCPRGCEGRWRRRPRPLSGRGWRGRRLLIVPVSSRVLAVEGGCSGLGRTPWAKLGDSFLRCEPLAPPREGRGSAAAPWPPRGGGPSLRGPSLEGHRVECRGFPPGFPSQPGVCVSAPCGWGRGGLCSSPLSPGAGVEGRVWRSCSASGFPVSCGETPPG